MATIDEDWQIPVAGWRFRKAILDRWCDGRIRELTPNRDFPPAMPFEEIKRRLDRAATLRDTVAYVWPTGEGGRIRIKMEPMGSTLRG